MALSDKPDETARDISPRTNPRIKRSYPRQRGEDSRGRPRGWRGTSDRNYVLSRLSYSERSRCISVTRTLVCRVVVLVKWCQSVDSREKIRPIARKLETRDASAKKKKKKKSRIKPTWREILRVRYKINHAESRKQKEMIVTPKIN